MIKKNYLNINLNCTMQEQELTAGACANGVLSINPPDGSFRFVEGVRIQKSYARNQKIYSGKHVNFVRMSNGYYQPHLRTIDATKVSNPEELAFEIYMELIEALNTMQ